jgi:hypothetical protein
MYISEILLNFSAFVYLLSFLFFLISLFFYNRKEYPLFTLFLIIALLFKETIFLAFLTLLFLKKELKGKIILIISLLSFIIVRIILQTGSSSHYTSFLSYKYLLIKIYLVFFRAININPYSIPPIIGFLIIILFLLISVLLIKKDKKYLFPLSFFFIYLSFFSVFPKLSSRYLFFPAIGFILFLSIALNDLTEKLKKFVYLLIIISFLYNSPLIRREVEDYKILGEFSKNYIKKQKYIIKNRFKISTPFTINQGNYESIKTLYLLIHKRGNLPKLLPIRKKAIGGMIYPEDLVPIIFYPKYIAIWKTLKKTNNGYYGKILILKRRQ